jgi:hypothetical protein
MGDYYGDQMRAQEDPVTLGELVGLNPKPRPGCAKCQSWNNKRRQARAHDDYAAAAAASETMWKHQLRGRCSE